MSISVHKAHLDSPEIAAVVANARAVGVEVVVVENEPESEWREFTLRNHSRAAIAAAALMLAGAGYAPFAGPNALSHVHIDPAEIKAIARRTGPWNPEPSRRQKRRNRHMKPGT